MRDCAAISVEHISLIATETEYLQNFGEKKNFLMSLIFLIFKGSQQPTKIEQYIIERTIIEYYREFFTPFEGFSEEEKKELHQTLVIAAKSNGEYEKYEEELQARNGTGSYDVVRSMSVTADSLRSCRPWLMTQPVRRERRMLPGTSCSD